MERNDLCALSLWKVTRANPTWHFSCSELLAHPFTHTKLTNACFQLSLPDSYTLPFITHFNSLDAEHAGNESGKKPTRFWYEEDDSQHRNLFSHCMLETSVKTPSNILIHLTLLPNRGKNIQKVILEQTTDCSLFHCVCPTKISRELQMKRYLQMKQLPDGALYLMKWLEEKPKHRKFCQLLDDWEWTAYTQSYLHTAFSSCKSKIWIYNTHLLYPQVQMEYLVQEKKNWFRHCHNQHIYIQASFYSSQVLVTRRHWAGLSTF